MTYPQENKREHLTRADLERKAEEALEVIVAFGTEDGKTIPDRLAKVIRQRLIESMLAVRNQTLATQKAELLKASHLIEDAILL